MGLASSFPPLPSPAVVQPEASWQQASLHGSPRSVTSPSPRRPRRRYRGPAISQLWTPALLGSFINVSELQFHLIQTQHSTAQCSTPLPVLANSPTPSCLGE